MQVYLNLIQLYFQYVDWYKVIRTSITLYNKETDSIKYG